MNVKSEIFLLTSTEMFVQGILKIFPSNYFLECSLRVLVDFIETDMFEK